MRAVLKGALAAALLAGGSLAGTAPAEAHDRGGTAVIAGLIGLGLGAAIASDSHHHHDHGHRAYGYDRPYNGYGSYDGYDQGYTGNYGYDRGNYAYGYDRSDYSDRRYRNRDGWNRWDRDDRDYYGR